MGEHDELPWVISVDDHVIEPGHVWSDRLPAGMRERGPHIERDTCEVVAPSRETPSPNRRGGDGPVVGWWVSEDLVMPIPRVSVAVGFPPESWTIDGVAFTDMPAGCYDPTARLADMDLNRTERSDLVARIAERVPPDELEMPIRGNAIRMLDLDPADLRPVGAR